MTESATPESGALSVEQAIATLEAPETVEQQAPEAPKEAAQEPEEPQGEASSPEDAEDGAEPPAEADETDAEPEAVAPVDPPKYWSQDAKAKFAELSPELQAVVLAQEGPREEATAKAKAEAAKQVETAQAEIGKVQQLADALADRLPRWVEAFESRWGTQTPDWVAYAQEVGVEAMTLQKTQFEAERQQLAEAAQAKQIADTQGQQARVQSEWKTLAEIAPDLAPDVSDPTKGSDKRQAVTKYLMDGGIPREAVAQISAAEMNISHKAMLWDQAQAKAAAAPKSTPKTPPVTKPLTRGGASPGPVDPQQKQAATIGRRFAQTKSIDDAVAYLNAKG